MAFLWRDLPGHRHAPAPAGARPVSPALGGGWFSRLRAWQDRSPWFGWRRTARDPLAPLIETARRLDYGAGRLAEPQDPDETAGGVVSRGGA
ncbi:hypothetical protein [Streptomyces sp. YU58]|uniref:hypothetical protein n=1 Tax=Streptomyces sp. SX92 TaxID=3158972 RepID=UPI0027B95927|nr:hypothetical protein [Streptomyces coralus]WLW53850.1 hypothetical protein QU709_21900 [Streptomyces coralus]